MTPRMIRSLFRRPRVHIAILVPGERRQEQRLLTEPSEERTRTAPGVCMFPTTPTVMAEPSLADGVSNLRRFRHVSFPLRRPLLLAATLLRRQHRRSR